MSNPAITQTTELTQHLSLEMRQKLTVLHTATHELQTLVRQEMRAEHEGARETMLEIAAE